MICFTGRLLYHIPKFRLFHILSLGMFWRGLWENNKEGAVCTLLALYHDETAFQPALVGNTA